MWIKLLNSHEDIVRVNKIGESRRVVMQVGGTFAGLLNVIAPLRMSK